MRATFFRYVVHRNVNIKMRNSSRSNGGTQRNFCLPHGFRLALKTVRFDFHDIGKNEF